MVGKAGPDLLRSPVKRCSHARFSRCKSHGVRPARRFEKPGRRNHHSECLELIAKAFGYDNWNILSAKIEAATPGVGAEPALSPAAAQEPVAPDSTAAKTLYCTFCHKSQYDVKKLIAGPSAYICDECVELCVDIIHEEGEFDKIFLLLKQSDDPAGAASAHGATTEKLADYVARSQKGVERTRLMLQGIRRSLAMRESGFPGGDDVPESPELARLLRQLKDKSREELLTMERQQIVVLKQYDRALRIGTRALAERGEGAAHDRGQPQLGPTGIAGSSVAARAALYGDNHHATGCSKGSKPELRCSQHVIRPVPTSLPRRLCPSVEQRATGK